MKHLLNIIIALLLVSCANIVPPTGGPIDEQAPSIIYGQSIPDSLHLTNYTAKTIVIAIDEQFKVQGLNSQLKANPALKEPVEYKIKKINKKKSHLIIEFKEELKPNTTYTLNFGTAIKDITEGNVLKTPNFVFSTGDYIDSLSVKGKITTTEQKPVANVLVGLYSSHDTVVPNKVKPIYSTYTDAQGNYTLSNLANNTYKIFAVEDKNKNKIYDSKSEKIGFINKTINPANRDTVDFTIFQQKDTVFRISSVRLKKTNTQLTFSQELKDVTIESKKSISHQFLANQKILALFPHEASTTKDLVHIIAKDENNNKIDTNISLKFTLDQTLIKSSNDIIKSIQTSDYQYFNDSLSFSIQIKEPVQELLFSNIYFVTDLDTTLLKNRASIKHDFSEDLSKINFTVKGEFRDSVKILMTDKFINGVQGNTNKSTLLSFATYNKKEYSSLRGTIITEEENYIFQLFRGKELIDTKYNNKTFYYPIMKPADYSIKILIDKNKNKKLDNGDYYKKEQAEIIYVYPNPIKLKANWEINNLKVSF